MDLTKYENASRKKLIYALSLTEKRAEKLAKQTEENNKAFKFLSSQLKKSLKTKRKPATKSYEPNDKTIKAINDTQIVGVFDSFNDYLNKKETNNA